MFHPLPPNITITSKYYSTDVWFINKQAADYYPWGEKFDLIKVMLNPYVVDYFLFTLLASFGILQIALAKESRARLTVGWIILIASYLWFFTSRDRNVHTVVEGVQLGFLFITSTGLAVIAMKILNILARQK